MENEAQMNECMTKVSETLSVLTMRECPRHTLFHFIATQHFVSCERAPGPHLIIIPSATRQNARIGVWPQDISVYQPRAEIGSLGMKTW